MVLINYKLKSLHVFPNKGSLEIMIAKRGSGKPVGSSEMANRLDEFAVSLLLLPQIEMNSRLSLFQNSYIILNIKLKLSEKYARQIMIIFSERKKDDDNL